MSPSTPDDLRALDHALAEALATLKLLAEHRAEPLLERIRIKLGRLLDPEPPTP